MANQEEKKPIDSDPSKLNFVSLKGSVSIRDRRYLPHWEKEGATYFVTFRLANSMPRHVIELWAEELANLDASVRKWQMIKKIERYLDIGGKGCLLLDGRCADIMAGALQFYEGERYIHFAWCVMPNHVHTVFQLLGDQRLSKVIQNWKSYTSHSINKVLGSKGEVWHREYFDHIVRSPQQLEKAIRYVQTNPMRAGLTDWKWVYPSISDG